MSVVIRMKRTGRAKRPCYRITVAESRFPRDGRTIESLGLYDPIAKVAEAQLRVDVERARYWLSKGAVPSETVASVFVRSGVWESRPIKPKRERPGRKKKTKTGEQRVVRKQRLNELKTARCEKRTADKRAASKAAAAAAAESAAE